MSEFYIQSDVDFRNFSKTGEIRSNYKIFGWKFSMMRSVEVPRHGRIILRLILGTEG